MSELEGHLKKFQKELSSGSVSLVLLAVLAGAEEPMYGYLIAKRLADGGEGVLAGKQSALYPVLRNLSASGLLDSEVEPSVAGPPRRYYRITALGREVLQQWISTWATTRDFVDSVLESNTSQGAKS
ncbi:MAG: PadR family transcriptional regulator [Xanthomonadales bacterium]|uniref:PadR family transcriptional regulator n=1 Tax=Dokdonella sp. TaxID=2291710 RepID=UPI002B6C08A7|nr:PadR family transcriptional regulator [Xanthomonadales bacterium]HQV72797.1 PadR family transcriptional regulator [Dokdonella sp.]MBK7209566.1 PadR family transcriptional regulator [Xanthomonadales bacterium]HQW76968.1 PadR family transcriptional regulator [Dokdonella sp.]HQX66578.1 PadR family transcriptional regulator [Dokdonella sp.]